MKARSFSFAILNGSLDDAAMLPFLDDLVEAGYEGVCFHPRDGMLAPYASRYFWERLDIWVGAARARDLAVWFYDEFPFPSGMGGGTFLEDNPQKRARELKFETISPQILPHSGEPGLIDIGAGQVLGVVRYRLKHDEIVEMREISDDCGGFFDTWIWGNWHNRFYTGTLLIHEEQHERAGAARWTRVYRPDVPLQDDERILAVKIAATPGQKGLGGHPDLTLPEVTDAFLEKIYRPLAEVSRRHGLEKAPVFQDEVHFGSLHPWNHEIAARLTANGEHPALLLARAHLRQSSDWESCRFQYRSACAQALEENWFARVAVYCHQSNLQMTGHLAGEESILGHAALLGNAFKSLRHFDIPGYDFISSHFFDENNRGQATGIKLVQSIAWGENRETAMAEIFGCNGFQSTLNQQRGILAWLALHDFTRTFDHSTYQSSLSVRKYDAPPVSNRFNPLQIGRPDLWNWQNQFCDLLEEYKFAPDTLILFPFDALTRYCPDETEVWREPVKRWKIGFSRFAASRWIAFLCRRIVWKKWKSIKPVSFITIINSRAFGCRLLNRCIKRRIGNCSGFSSIPILVAPRRKSPFLATRRRRSFRCLRVRWKNRATGRLRGPFCNRCGAAKAARRCKFCSIRTTNLCKCVAPTFPVSRSAWLVLRPVPSNLTAKLGSLKWPRAKFKFSASQQQPRRRNAKITTKLCALLRRDGVAARLIL